MGSTAEPGPAPEERPRPAYGEYATPEEQRAAIRLPLPEAPAPPAASLSSVPHHAPLPVPRPTTTAARPTRRADRIITLALVVYGFITVLSAVPQLWHFNEFAQTWMTLAGIDATFTNTAAGDLWGRIGAAVFAIGWLITALLSWRSVIRGRLSWWIPLVGAIATFVLVSVCLTVPLLGDPAVVAHFGR